MQRTITKIAPVMIQQAPRLLRVAAYARVSSGKEAMLHSLSAQVSHYSDRIQKTPGWIYAGVYADEATTGHQGQPGRVSEAAGTIAGPEKSTWLLPSRSAASPAIL